MCGPVFLVCLFFLSALHSPHVTDAADVAFNAHLSSDTDVEPGAIIMYSNVSVNEGEAYADGVFTCADDGVYVFYWSLLRSPDSASERCTSSLQMGDNQMVKYGPMSDVNRFEGSGFGGTALMSTVLQCQQDSPVYTIAMNTGGVCRYSFLCTNFAGFRLSDGGAAIAFSAMLSTDTIVDPGNRIVFDDVIANFNGAYSGESGAFTCPITGLYVFSVTTQTAFRSSVEATEQWSTSRIMRDGNKELDGPQTYPAVVEYGSGSASTSLVLLCEENQQVYVESQQAFTFEDGNAYAVDLTSFTGFYLGDSVAFSAVMTQNRSNSGFIVPDRVITNSGDAYDSGTGIFTCPDNELYVFTWSGINDNGDTYMDLYFNGLSVQWLDFTPSLTSASSGSNSQSYLLRCIEGIPIRLYQGSIRTQIADYTIFTGYRLPPN